MLRLVGRVCSVCRKAPGAIMQPVTRLEMWRTECTMTAPLCPLQSVLLKIWCEKKNMRNLSFLFQWTNLFLYEYWQLPFMVTRICGMWCSTVRKSWQNLVEIFTQNLYKPYYTNNTIHKGKIGVLHRHVLILPYSKFIFQVFKYLIRNFRCYFFLVS